MRRDKTVRQDLERLLGKAFPDDLPADAEEMMRRQLDRFRQRWVEKEREDALVSIRPRRWTAALIRISLAAVSVLIIILGLRLRASSPRADLGSSLASLQWEAFFSARIMDFQSMECAVRLDRPEEPSQHFVIQWLSPEETLVRLVIAGEESVRTVYPPKSERSVLELIAKSGPDETAAPPHLEAELRPVEGLLSSAQLRKLLDGRWRLAGTERRDGCDWKSFSVTNAPDASPSRITVDTCTSLPVRLEKEVGSGERIEAVFRWVPQSEPRGLLFPRHVSRSAAETTPS
jgi:hypothetical protein